MRSDTIAARATPAGTGGLAVIRVCGTNAIPVAEAVFTPAGNKTLSMLAGYTAAFGRFRDAGGFFDEGVALVFRAPASFTGEDIVELSCHGGIYVAERLLNALYDAGASPAEPGEFTRRAFVNGKMDLSAAESVLSLIQASSELALRSAFEDRNGRLFAAVNEIKNNVIKSIADIAAWIDYPDEDVPPPDGLSLTIAGIQDDLESLLAGYENGRILREGIHTAIIGRPNTGKSAMMNRLSGMDRSIVTEHAGTTRDIVEESVRLGNITLRLADTAGIRAAQNPVEVIGVERALQKAEEAELLLAVFDGSQAATSEDKTVIAACRGKKALALLNKCDLPSVFDPALFGDGFMRILRISAKTGEGFDLLEKSVESFLTETDIEQAAPFNARQRDCTVRALTSVKEAADSLQNLTPDVVQMSLESAAAALMELTGEVVTEKVLDDVFSRFCVGK